MLPVCPVLTSDLPALKLAAKCLAVELAEHSGMKPLSAFKRNDLVATALGYKGFSDLEYCAKRRSNARRQPVGNILARSSGRIAIEMVLKRDFPDLPLAIYGQGQTIDNCCTRASVAYYEAVHGSSDVIRDLCSQVLENDFRSPGPMKHLELALQTSKRAIAMKDDPAFNEQAPALMKDVLVNLHGARAPAVLRDKLSSLVDPCFIVDAEEQMYGLQLTRLLILGQVNMPPDIMQNTLTDLAKKISLKSIEASAPHAVF